MTTTDREKWKAVLDRQRFANINRWLHTLQESNNPSALVDKEYENILRALETALETNSSVKLAYQLADILHPIVLEYADWARWLTYLKTLQTQLGDEQTILQANVIMRIGDVKMRMGELHAAEIAYQKGADLYQALAHQEKRALAMGRLAIILNLRGETGQAVLLCQEAINLAQQQQAPDACAQLYLNLSSIHFNGRQWTESLVYSQKAYNLFRQQNKHKEATKALVNIAAISAEIGDWQQLERLSTGLLEDLSGSGDIAIVSKLKNILGVAAYHQKRFAEAEAYWHKALILHSQINEPAEMAGLYNNLGMVYTKLHEWDEAEQMLKKGLALYESLNDTYHWGNAIDNLADLMIAQQKVGEATDFLIQGISVLQREGSFAPTADLIENMRCKLALIIDNQVPS